MPKMSAAVTRKLANAAGKERREPSTELAWSAALAEAPVPIDLPDPWVPEFRKAYAAKLVKLGYAKVAGRAGASGKPGTATKLHRRLVNAPLSEFEAQDEKAREEGVSWSLWARRKLSQ